MRFRRAPVETLALSASASCLALACSGGAASSAPPSAELPLASTEHRVTPRHTHAPNLSPAGSGFVGYVLCNDGKSCAGALAQTQFTGEFSPTDADAGPGPACSYVFRGSCEVATCTGTGGAPPGVGAGTLTIGGGSFGTVPLTTTKAADFQYGFTQSGSGFSPGDALTVSGSGGRVPAFGTQTLIARAPITLAHPAAGKGGDFMLSTTTALKVRWSGGTAGDLVFIEGDATTTEVVEGGVVPVSVSFSCGWDALANEGTVSEAVLAPMAGLEGDFLWGEESLSTFDAGLYTVNYTIQTFGDAPAKYE